MIVVDGLEVVGRHRWGIVLDHAGIAVGPVEVGDGAANLLLHPGGIGNEGARMCKVLTIALVEQVRGHGRLLAGVRDDVGHVDRLLWHQLLIAARQMGRLVVAHHLLVLHALRCGDGLSRRLVLLGVHVDGGDRVRSDVSSGGVCLLSYSLSVRWAGWGVGGERGGGGLWSTPVTHETFTHLHVGAENGLHGCSRTVFDYWKRDGCGWNRVQDGGDRYL